METIVVHLKLVPRTLTACSVAAPPAVNDCAALCWDDSNSRESITLHARDASLARSNSCERQGANYQRGARDNSYHPEMDSIRAFL